VSEPLARLEAGGAAAPRPLHASVLVTYGLPMLGYMQIQMLFTLYFVKYATDVLLLRNWEVGLISLVGRVWDGVSDPVAGYLSDRTRSRLGRRRPWLLASAPIVPLCTLALWSPPALGSPGALVAWTFLAYLAFEGALTIFAIPHIALGAELSPVAQDRTRLFAYRNVAVYGGMLLALGAMHWLLQAEDKRAAAPWVALACGGLFAALVVWAGLRMREPAEHRDRGPQRAVPAFGDLLRNRHARLLLAIFFIENLGSAPLAVLGAYYMQYIVGAEEQFPVLVLSAVIPTVAVAPLVVRATRAGVDKRRLWRWSMALSALGFGALFFGGPGRTAYLCLCGALVGVATGISAVVAPALQADIVDYDEFQTGERKEGVYFASWNFIRKCAIGIAIFLTQLVLDGLGYQPGVEQPESTRLAIRVMFSLVPAAMYALGLLLFLRFGFSDAEHRRIRELLDRRAPGATHG
jgi:GPH family glycoside/pentoside/hexuronide:cation symporter